MIVPTAQSVTTIAAMHAQGDSLRILIASIGGGSTPTPTPPGSAPALSGLRAQTFPAADPGAVSDALEAAGVQVLVRVLSSAQTIAKSVQVAELDSGESQPVMDALALLAETELSINLPVFRRAAGAIRPGGQRFPDRKATGLLTGWPALATTPHHAAHRSTWPCPEVVIAEVAALAALAQASGGCEQAVYLDLDRSCGSALAAGPQKTIARVFRLPADDAAAQSQAAARTLAETTQSAGLTRPAAIPSTAQALLLDPSPAGPPVPPELRDAAWRANFGLAFGALFAFANTDPTLAALANLHEREPKARPPIWERAIRWFGHPMRAAAAFILCLLLLLGLPLSVAYARYADLKKTTGGETTVTSRSADTERQVAFYHVLKEKRWPMTKLLGDVSASAPVGVMLDSIDLNQADTVTIRGSATSSDLVTSFRENLTKTQVFTQVKTPTISTANTPSGSSSSSSAAEKDAGVTFSLTASIPSGAAIVAAKAADDFAAKTMVERLYGAGKTSRRSEASATHTGRSPAPAAAASQRDSGGNSGRNERRAARNSGGNTPASDRSTTHAAPPTPGASAASDVPPPLTPDKLAKLDLTQAMLEWAKRKKASTQSGLDEAVRKRLTDEADKAKARMEELKGEVKPAPGAGGGQ